MNITRVAPILLLTACSSLSSDDDLSFDDFVDGKSDTGYVGNRAAEVDATIAGRVRVAVPHKTPEELRSLADAIKANPTSWSHWHITDQVTEQVKYARNALLAEKLNLNLEGGRPTYASVEPIEGGLELVYSLRIESLIKFKELEAKGLKPSDLVGKTVNAELPLVPQDLYKRVGDKCATGHASGDLDADGSNLFYYFAPRKDGCPLTNDDLITARYEITSSADAPTVYPEYDQLVADGKISVVGIFGQITHGELKDWDSGFSSFNRIKEKLESLGFSTTETFPENRGRKMFKRYGSGLEVTVDLYTPVGFADHVPREDANARFKDAMLNHEIFYYGGHSFYGSLGVLDDKTAYPADTYQIIFMDSCWSYAYYTKQVFRSKATESDPEGWEYADVVNNTEPGLVGSEIVSWEMYATLFEGADKVYAEESAERFSWNNIIEYMNMRAEQRSTGEIYGVSGVRTNSFQPDRE